MEFQIRTKSLPRFGAEARGYSLIETMIALAISLICVAASVSWFLFQNASMSVASARVNADETVAFAAYEINRAWSQIGGGSVQPWAAVWVEDNSTGCNARGPLPDCDGSDRVTLAELDTDIPECPLQGFSAASGALTSIEIEDYSGGGPIPTWVCCIKDFAGRQIYVTDDSGNTMARYVTSVNSSTCTASTEPVRQALSNLRYPASGAFPNLEFGVISPVTISTYYLDRSTQQLWEWTDKNNDYAISTDEVRSVAAQIFDLQVALGYDANGDSVITDNKSATDEWLYNATGDALGAGMLATATPQKLREIGFSIAAGTKTSPSNSPTNSRFERWNGPARDLNGWQVYGRSRKVLPRNIRLVEEF